jgi:predicted secreted protein
MGEEKDVQVVQVGKKFSIDLEAMPGAGYMWEMTRVPEEIELISQDVVSISKAIGGSSTQRFLLLAHASGSYELVFQLKRSWEPDPARTCRFSIRAE